MKELTKEYFEQFSFDKGWMPVTEPDPIVFSEHDVEIITWQLETQRTFND